ncbi:MAG TPA: hypothetical protein PKD98_03740, partial [Anaerolineae bacterium]|nr:hypothetical protein [Anaerolineae bacterium]
MYNVRNYLVVLVIALLMALAGCGGAAPEPAASGGGGESNNSGESSSAEEAAEAAPSGETIRQAFGGGPVGGAFQTFANAMSLIIADATPNLELSAEGTGGSGANLRAVNSDDVQYGIVYAGDVYLGGLGQLPEDTTQYTDVRPVA